MKFATKFEILVLIVCCTSLSIQPVMATPGVEAGDEYVWKIYGKVDWESTDPDYALIGVAGQAYNGEISVNITKIEGNIIFYTFCLNHSWFQGDFYDDINDVPVSNYTSTVDANDCDINGSTIILFIDSECQNKEFSDTITHKGHSGSIDVQYDKKGVLKSYKRALSWTDREQGIRYTEEFTIIPPISLPSYTPNFLILFSAVSILGIIYRIKEKK